MAGGYYSAWDNWTSSTFTTSSASTSIYSDWCQQGTCDSSTGRIWVSWTQGTQGTTTTGADTWYYWNPQQQQEYQQHQPYPYVETKEERRKREEAAKKRQDEERIRMEEVAKQQKAAEEKALQLLLENLEENQAEIFKQTGAIPVVAKSGRRYSIRKGTSGNVDELVDQSDVKKARLCFHPSDYSIPVYDVMLAQKLMLEICEEDARRIANFS
jgi:hypothetical protein